MQWRTIFAQGEDNGQPSPDDFEIITPEMIQNRELKQGDYVSPTKDIATIDRRSVFRRGKLYKFYSYDDSVVKNSFSVVADTGYAYLFGFIPGGGADWWMRAVFRSQQQGTDPETPEEMLGQWNTLPLEVLQMLKDHPGIRRDVIIREVAAANGQQVTSQFRATCLQLFAFLVKHQFIQSGDKLGTFTMLPAGAEVLRKYYERQ